MRDGVEVLRVRGDGEGAQARGAEQRDVLRVEREGGGDSEAAQLGLEDAAPGGGLQVGGGVDDEAVVQRGSHGAARGVADLRERQRRRGVLPRRQEGRDARDDLERREVEVGAARPLRGRSHDGGAVAGRGLG